MTFSKSLRMNLRSSLMQKKNIGLRMPSQAAETNALYIQYNVFSDALLNQI